MRRGSASATSVAIVGLGAMGSRIAGRLLAGGHDVTVWNVAFDVLEVTPLAAQARRRRAAIESGDFPPRFALRLARKDAELILEAAETAGADLPIGSAMRSLLADAEGAGWGDRDYSAIIAHVLSSGRRGIG